MTGQRDPSLPLVSAITIFLDAEPFLEAAIGSVLAQSYPAWELLLVDDGSTDSAPDIARRYAAEHPARIRCLHHPGRRNRGMSASRNLGLAHAQGDYIAFLDADDFWLPDKLERQIEILAAHPEALMTCAPTRLWYGWTGDAADARRDALREIRNGPDALHEPPQLLRLYLQDRALTPATCSVMIRRAAFARTGGFEERFTGLYEDQAFFIKAFLTLPCFVTTRVLDLYRQHGGSHSAAALRAGQYSEDQPSRALAGLLLWCARYFARERVTDPELWAALLRKLSSIALNRAVGVLNRPAKRLIGGWYRLTGLRYRRHRDEVG